MELEKVFTSRASVRSYTGEKVTENQINALLKAANAAPVGRGKYDTIHLSVITNEELLKEIDANGAAFFGNPDMHPLYGAPLLIVVSSSEEGNVASANVGMIVHNMALEAVNLGLGQVCIYGATVALTQNADLVKKLNLPDGFTPLGSLAVGPGAIAYAEREIPDKIATDYLD